MNTPNYKIEKYDFTFPPLLFLFTTVLVVAITIASISTQTKTTNIHKAARIIGAELRSARTLAVSTKTYIAVLMPTAQKNDAGGVNESQYKARAVRLCSLSNKPDYLFMEKSFHGRFGSYVENSSWKLLPAEIYIGYTSTHGGYHRNSGENRCNVIDHIPFPEEHNIHTFNTMRAVIFSPTGAALSAPQGGSPGTNDISLTVFSGRIKNGDQLWEDADVSETITIRINSVSGKIVYEYL